MKGEVVNMSEIRTATARAEIIVKNLKNGKIMRLSGRYGTFSECYEHARKSGYKLIQYMAIF